MEQEEGASCPPEKTFRVDNDAEAVSSSSENSPPEEETVPGEAGTTQLAAASMGPDLDPLSEAEPGAPRLPSCHAAPSAGEEVTPSAAL